ncbi:HAMP domain-containing sensor histidine kinase [Leptolyngbya sp. 'hensonii']|uniref:sensor histidine kinase n=1 Tax=Leptolyngbya sp. 'hensonii' TaxID=1922337 RepID=UPI001C0DB5ED|nr:HAMP domain-containing sensor histidine kinase [Leptolyngbya sp. 'hensonii']
MLPTLSEVIALSDAELGGGLADGLHNSTEPAPGSIRSEIPRPAFTTTQNPIRAEQQWFGAIAALNALLFQSTQSGSHPIEGVVLASPSSPLSDPVLISKLSTWVFTTSSLGPLGWLPFQLPPGGEKQGPAVQHASCTLPLLPLDPLADEQFCLLLTHQLSILLVLGQDHTGQTRFHFSFDPATLLFAWNVLRPRVLVTVPHQIDRLDELVGQFTPTAPDYRLVTRFSRLLLGHLPDLAERIDPRKTLVKEDSKRQQTESYADHSAPALCSPAPDVELLRAIAHEIRTPLTTIRTLTRSLLKRQDLSAVAIQRLEMIDRQCSEQIDRFDLIFKAAELETATSRSHTMPLAATPLDQVFQQGIPRWKQQASQRNLTLEVLLPQQMPTVVSDPTILDQALTGLMERFTRNLPAGSHIQVEVTAAGDQLKLQLQSSQSAGSHSRPSLKALGQLLAFQPETGSVSLSMAVTKNLFQALGGKLIVRQRPQQGEVLTIFLPLERTSLEMRSSDIRTV